MCPECNMLMLQTHIYLDRPLTQTNMGYIQWKFGFVSQNDPKLWHLAIYWITELNLRLSETKV